MDDNQFRQWQELLETRTGMTLPAERRSFLQANLGIRMREIGCKSYQDYYERVASGTGAIVEWATLVDRLTVQETRFFRDLDAFSLVSDYILTRPRDSCRKTPWKPGASAAPPARRLTPSLSCCRNAWNTWA